MSDKGWKIQDHGDVPKVETRKLLCVCDVLRVKLFPLSHVDALRSVGNSLKKTNKKSSQSNKLIDWFAIFSHFSQPLEQLLFKGAPSRFNCCREKDMTHFLDDAREPGRRQLQSCRAEH